MGKKFRKRSQKKKTSNYDKKPNTQRKTHYEDLKRENKDFETYYKAQKIVPSDEWEEFMKCLKEDLPAAFRITGTKCQCRALLSIMKQKFFKPAATLEVVDLTTEDPVKPMEPMCLPWYPNGLAWQLNLTRRDIRRVEPYWKLHHFLISETETGNISRQESVSMIPPILLDVKPHHKVLDLCAAPGSKTAQMIEFLHGLDSEFGNGVPSGVVVANDVDNRRCYMLTHQAKRMQSPTLIITNHDAAFMPNIFHTRKDNSVVPVKFDRILCDVPCSGDATFRKNFDVWGKWNSLNGANLHGLQLRIARRGVEMLAVGGVMVYSTCSFNPLENEAVVNRLLAESSGCLRLKDVSGRLPGLKTMPGLESWVIMTREIEIVKSAEEIPEKDASHFHQQLFPPSVDVLKERNLRRCIRILPHHQNTGGFFVAVIEKIKHLPGEKLYPAEGEEKKTEGENGDVPAIDGDNKGRELKQRIKQPPRKRMRGFREEPFYYFSEENKDWAEILSFFNINNCPTSKEALVRSELLLTRTPDGNGRNVYFTNNLVKDIIAQNQDRVKLINAGVKVLVRCDNKGTECHYRLAQDGIHTMAPLFSGRKIVVGLKDLVVLLHNEDLEDPPQISDMDPSIAEQCESLSCGSVVFVYKEKYDDATDADDLFTICMVGWKGQNSLRCYVARAERLHYLTIVGADTSAFEKNKFKLNAEKQNGDTVEEGKEEVLDDPEKMDEKCEEQNGNGQVEVQESVVEEPSIVEESEKMETDCDTVT